MVPPLVRGDLRLGLAGGAVDVFPSLARRGQGEVVMPRVFNRSESKDTRRRLRKAMTRAEAVVWAKLRRKQILGHVFRRQYSVGPYVIDFYCPGLKLAVEIDGDSHFLDGAEAADQRREAFISGFGIRFLRFTNEEVYRNLEGVLESITQVALEHTEREA